MNKKIILWVAAIVITFLAAFLHQRTGPYYPVSGSIGIEGERLTYMFQKVHYGEEPFRIMMRTDKEDLHGNIKWKKKEDTEWNFSPLRKDGKYLAAEIKPLSAGTEIVYKGVIIHSDKTYEVPFDSNVEASFTGKRPSSVMYVFYFFLFGGLLIAFRGALEYFNPRDKKMLFSILPAMFFFVTSIVFYPFIKSYELDAINKSIPPIGMLFDIPLLAIFLLWFVSSILIFKYKNKILLLVSGILTLIIYQLSNFY
jgi:hypothetical protein